MYLYRVRSLYLRAGVGEKEAGNGKQFIEKGGFLT
jgi:hypothetical protein